MDHLTLDFHYKGKKSLWRFKEENITDKMIGVDRITIWSGYVEFDGERRYFHKLRFWYIVKKIVEILDDREVFIKLSLRSSANTCFYKRSILL